MRLATLAALAGIAGFAEPASALDKVKFATNWLADPETGKTQWEWFSTPPPGTPNATTGGMTWMTGTYDPALNLVFWGTDRKSVV